MLESHVVWVLVPDTISRARK